MSSSDRRPGAPRHLTRRGALVMLGGLTALAGCTVHPVYMTPDTGTGKPGSKSVVDLSVISVGPVGTRVGQQVRNNLIFDFTGGKTPPPALYVLEIEVDNSEQQLGFKTDETAPAYQVTVSVRFELKSIADDHTLLRSVSSGFASYERSNQNFANERARINAENRAAQSVADEIRLRLALAISKDMKLAPSAMPAQPNIPAGGTPSIISNQM